MTLLPFMQKVYPDGHRLVQDNYPKHTSKYGVQFLQQHGINIRRDMKLKDELVRGTMAFWATVDVAKYTKYIRHLDKVILHVIELEGGATGY